MANTRPLPTPAPEAPPQHERPRTSYPHNFHTFFRGATRKKSLTDLGSALLAPPSKRPRTVSEACLHQPTNLRVDAQTATEQQRIDSGLTSSSPTLQRSSTLRNRTSRRTRSSFGGWMSSINEFRKEAGNKLRNRGPFPQRSVSIVDNTDVSRADSLGPRNAPNDKLLSGGHIPSEGPALVGPRGRPLEVLPMHVESQEYQRTLSPAGGEGARAAAAALARVTEKTRQLTISDASDPMACPTTIRRRSNTSDVESGIGVWLSPACSTTRFSESRIAGHDPSRLPVELFSKVLNFLDAESLMNAERVSRAWNAAASSNHVWKHIFSNEFVIPAEQAVGKRECALAGGLGVGKRQGPQQWKKMWVTRQRLNQRWQDGHAAAIYLEGHSDSVYCAQFDEQKIVTGSRDWTLRVWDAHTYECKYVLGVAKDSAPAHGSLDTRKIQGQQPSVSRIPNAGTPKHVQNDEKHTGSVLCMQYDDEIMVTGSSDTTLIVWSMKDYKIIKRLRHHRMGVLDVCFNEKYIIACSKDMNISVWDRNTLELVKCLEGHRGPVNAVQMRGNLVCSASGDGVAKLWDLTTGLPIKEFSTPSAAPEVRSRGLACIEFTKDGRILAGGNDRTVYQFNTVTGSLEHRYEGHEALVRSLHYDAANDRVVSGSYDHSVKAYDLKTQRMICDFKDWTTSWMLSAKSDYRRIVATSQDARAMIVDFGFDLPNVGLLASA